MDAQMQKHRMTHWLGRFVAALLLVLFATASPAQAAVESVAPKSGGTVWYNNWGSGGPFASADAACRAPGTCPVCGSLTYVGTVPNPNVPGDMNCMFFYNPGDGTAGWNTVSGTAIPYSNAVCPPTANPTVPYQYNPVTGMCERDAPCLAPNVLNPATGQCEPPKNLTITLYGGTTTEPSTLLPFNAVVKDQNDVVQSGKQVTITANVQDGAGGHIHTANRPKGSFTCSSALGASPASCTLTTDSSGQVPFEFVATPISGTHTITATCDGCGNTETKLVDVKVNGLIPISGSSGYALQDSAGAVIGAIPGKHTANHYLTSASITKLKVFAQEYQITNPGAKLYLNDASLVWGGLFDVGSTPWSSPHNGHDRGVSIDIRAANSGVNNEGAVPATAFADASKSAAKAHAKAALHCSDNGVLRIGAPCNGIPNNRHFHVDF